MFNKNSILFDDLYRYTGTKSWFLFFRYFFFTPGYRYLVFWRFTKGAHTLLGRLFWKMLMRQCGLRTGIQIPEGTEVEKGFKIGHFGMILMGHEVKCGKNFNISQGCSIGQGVGKKNGQPTFGDNVCVQPNSVIVGNIKIGSNVVIAPLSYVDFDVPDHSIVIGNPAKIIPRQNASDMLIVYACKD